MTAPTSDERRRVARAMREVKDGEYAAMFIDEILEGILGQCRDDDYQIRDRKILARLAELIDPTCNVVTSGEWRGGPIGSACSVCHAPLYPSTAWAHGMRYCSQCGARVVDGAEGEDE